MGFFDATTTHVGTTGVGGGRQHHAAPVILPGNIGAVQWMLSGETLTVCRANTAPSTNAAAPAHATTVSGRRHVGALRNTRCAALDGQSIIAGATKTSPAGGSGDVAFQPRFRGLFPCGGGRRHDAAASLRTHTDSRWFFAPGAK